MCTSQVLALQTGVWDQLRHGLMDTCDDDHGLASTDNVSPRVMAQARKEYGIDDDTMTNKTDVYRAAVRMMLDQVRARAASTPKSTLPRRSTLGSAGAQTPC